MDEPVLQKICIQAISRPLINGAFMKTVRWILPVILSAMLYQCKPSAMDFKKYPSLEISNDHVEMKLFLPDTAKGLYRATRFDWSGVIMSVKYKDHEYFGYWKDTHNPLFHEDLAGPVEGYIKPGIGYDEAEPGEGFIRIGVGIIEKEDEPEYVWNKTYRILDHGNWNVNNGADWVKFSHEIKSDSGYSYVYLKTVRLTDNGFNIEHKLLNKGDQVIETDQFNHNFFMIDGQTTGPAFRVSFPFSPVAEGDLEDKAAIEGNDIVFLRELGEGETVFSKITGFGPDLSDHQVTVQNQETGAGVTYSVDKPLYDMVFWASPTTLCPENSVWISVAPGKEETWKAEYRLFVE